MKPAFIRTAIASITLTFSCTLFADGHAPQAYIVTPSDGATVPSTFKVVFGLSGMGIAPAGVEREKTGHHHLLVDMKQLPALDQPLGSDVKHFGGGQTETTLTLPPGKHTLQLILGDHLHKPHNPPVVSKRITIEVK